MAGSHRLMWHGPEGEPQMPARLTAPISKPPAQRRHGRPAGAVARWLASGSAALCALAIAGLPASQAQAATATWAVVPSPNRTGPSTLTGVSCASAKSCIAVGYYVGGSGAYRTLAESWNGKTWSLTKIPNEGSGSNLLTGVSCASAKSCMAVGYYQVSSGAVLTLAESWNGSKWKVTSPSNPSSTYDQLNGVSCAGAKNCMAVGFADIGSTTVTVAESWNGTTWNVTDSLNPGGSYTLFGGVSCVSPASCVAVGSYFDGVSENLTLVESWNGSTWSVSSSPSPGAMNFLAGVSCVSSTRCVAAGEATTAALTTEVIEYLKGGTWQQADTSAPGTSSDQFNGVSCASSSSCVAVGAATSGAVTDTLIETLTGGSWKVTTSPDPSSSDNSLGGVSCVAKGSCAAAGSHGPAASSKTLIEATF
jgi:hypothetical protein